MQIPRRPGDAGTPRNDKWILALGTRGSQGREETENIARVKRAKGRNHFCDSLPTAAWLALTLRFWDTIGFGAGRQAKIEED